MVELFKNNLENELLNFYETIVKMSFGFSAKYSRNFVRKIIQECKKDLIRWGYDFEESGIKTAKAIIARKTEKYQQIFEKLKQDHVTRFNIIEWWNRPMLEIEVEKRFEAKIKYAMVLYFARDLNISQEDAYKKFIQFNYIFGNTDPLTPHTSDSPLPWELKMRIENNDLANNEALMDSEVYNYTSCNAWIRDKLERGLI